MTAGSPTVRIPNLMPEGDHEIPLTSIGAPT
jgi:hypothetical protein